MDQREREREREMFYLTTHSTHFIYGYMASDIWLRTILIVSKETRCRHIGYSYRLTARVLLYAPSHRQDNTYHGLCYTSHGALAGMRNSSMGPPHEGSIRRPIAPWANALPLSYVPLPTMDQIWVMILDQSHIITQNIVITVISHYKYFYNKKKKKKSRVISKLSVNSSFKFDLLIIIFCLNNKLIYIF